MKSMLIFPFKVDDDNNKAFAFTLELARRSNSNIIAATSLDLKWNHQNEATNFENLIDKRKDDIYINMLEMKGYYMGHYNQWDTFNKVKIHIRICDNDLNSTICSIIDDNDHPSLVIQYKYFSGSGISEQILSNPSLQEAKVYILPTEEEFDGPSPDLIGIILNDQKKSSFNRLLNEIKMFDLPGDYSDFKQYIIIQEAG